jgi:phosphate starvation-inducible protein PhoH and related proteins
MLSVCIIFCFIFLSDSKLQLSMKIKKPSINNINMGTMFSCSPKGENQQKYIEALENDVTKVVLVNGPAGTGKTFFACLKSIHKLKLNEIDKIVITRPVVTVEEEIGFLPGNLVKKMDPWTKPIFDIFLDFYSVKDLESMIHNNVIEICPLAFMRGRTFKNAFIIADEMQNSSPNQMKMITTRLGYHSKIVVTGDINQSDLQTNNGFSEILQKTNLYNKYNTGKDTLDMIKIIELTNGDIQRSQITKHILDIYDYKHSNIKELKVVDIDRLYKR